MTDEVKVIDIDINWRRGLLGTTTDELSNQSKLGKGIVQTMENQMIIDTKLNKVLKNQETIIEQNKEAKDNLWNLLRWTTRQAQHHR